MEKNGHHPIWEINKSTYVFVQISIPTQQFFSYPINMHEFCNFETLYIIQSTSGENHTLKPKFNKYLGNTQLMQQLESTKLLFQLIPSLPLRLRIGQLPRRWQLRGQASQVLKKIGPLTKKNNTTFLLIFKILYSLIN